MGKNTNAKQHRRLKNVKLLEKLSYLGDNQVKTNIELIQYNVEKFTSRAIGNNENIKKLIDGEKVNWIKVTGFSDVEVIHNMCNSLNIKYSDIKDMLSANRITKVISYANITFFLTSICNSNNFSQVGLILGKNFVISLQETGEPVFDDIKQAIADSLVNIREKKADYLLYILLNDIHSTYNETLMKLSDSINEMEDKLVDNEDITSNIIRFIQQHKKDYIQIKRSVTALREEYVNLLHNTNQLIENENKTYFEDFDDKLRTSLDDLEMYYQSINSLADLYFNHNSLKMNTVIKKLTIVSTIFMPLTFMVGVWGMNFKFMPELSWKHGYLFSWGIIVVMALFSWLFLRHKKWF
ncbi:MAG: magnesium/cobalt transporter CorA [Tannerella sp.]|jgi:magnesium transporter|nr:magnesium/cobalt transporter CorA [Tannerella sp.]